MKFYYFTSGKLFAVKAGAITIGHLSRTSLTCCLCCNIHAIKAPAAICCPSWCSPYPGCCFQMGLEFDILFAGHWAHFILRTLLDGF